LSPLVFPAQDDTNGVESYEVRHLSGSLVTIRRPPTFDIYEKQMKLVRTRSRLRADRSAEILSQVTPQFAYWAGICNLHPETTPRTIEVLFTALFFSMLITQRIKHALDCPRPNDVSSLVQPIIMAPAYTALPMGHATEAYMFARVMSSLCRQDLVVDEDLAVPSKPASQMCDQLYRLARRISDNRVIAGIHFPIDAPAGYVLARALSDYFVARSGSTPTTIKGTAFDGEKYRPEADIDPRRVFEEFRDASNATTESGPPGDWMGEIAIVPSKLLATLWTDAQEELRAQGFSIP
jgi:hypothetical protein